jgi:DNA repair protein RecO (recombination protein O)
VYGDAIRHLAATSAPAPVLRNFELELLRLTGYELSFDADASTGAEVEATRNYEYRAELGAVPVSRGTGPMVFSGAELIGIREQRFDDSEVLQAAGRLLRYVIRHHLGGRELKSRKVLVDLVRGRDRIAGS